MVVTHSATAMAATCALLGLSQRVHVLGPLANCHWSDVVREEHPDGTRAWRLRAHNVGAAGTVVPHPAPGVLPDESAPDAEA